MWTQTDKAMRRRFFVASLGVFFVSRPGEGFLLLGSAYERHLLRAMFPVWRDHVVVVYATIMKDDEVK